MTEDEARHLLARIPRAEFLKSDLEIVDFADTLLPRPQLGVPHTGVTKQEIVELMLRWRTIAR